MSDKRNLPALRSTDGVPTLRFADADWPLGPAMLALPNDRMRAFVIAYTQICNPFQRGAKGQAARLAGYEANKDNISHQGSDLMMREDVQLAIAEMDEHKFRGELSHKTHRAVEAALGNPASKIHGKAVELMMARIRPVSTLVHHKHERVEDHDTQSLNILREMKKQSAPREALVYQFGEIGLARLEAMLAKESGIASPAKDARVIDAEFTSIEDAPVSEDDDW